MIKEIQITAINQVREMLFDMEYQSDIGRNRNLFVYRGLPKASYELTTSLQRYCKHHKDELEELLLNNFAKYAEMDNPNVNSSIWHKMILGQHHGLPTRLLDWSRSPLMALHFATTEVSMDKLSQRDCVVWRVDVEKINRLLPEDYQKKCEEKRQLVFTIDMLNEICKDKGIAKYDADMGNNSMVMLEPPTIDTRIANQYSYFSVVPSGIRRVDDIFDKCEEGAVVKYIISRNLRWEIRDMLDQVNISERIVYPGLDGIAKWLGRYYFVRDLSKISIQGLNIALLDADIVVNPSNEKLLNYGGVGKAIFHEAGETELSDALKKLLPVKSGDIVATPGFGLKARYILHAVSAFWDGTKEAEKKLSALYEKSLSWALENNCHSIGFPLLSAGAERCPYETAWNIAIKTCYSFLKAHPGYPLDITFCTIREELRMQGEEIRKVIMGEKETLDKDYLYVDK